MAMAEQSKRDKDKQWARRVHELKRALSNSPNCRVSGYQCTRFSAFIARFKRNQCDPQHGMSAQARSLPIETGHTNPLIYRREK